jgi:hypothetical protein
MLRENSIKKENPQNENSFGDKYQRKKRTQVIK